MLRLSSKSLISSCKKSAVNFGGFKLAERANNIVPKKNSYFFSTNIPRDDEESEVKIYNARMNNSLTTVGLGLIGGLCAASGLIHLDCLHGSVLALSGMTLAVIAIHPINEGNEFNWAGQMSVPLLVALISKLSDKGLHAIFQVQSHLGPFINYFPGTVLLSATVFGAAALYTRFASQVSIFRPALVGTFAGTALIAAEHSIIGSSFLSELYKPE